MRTFIVGLVVIGIALYVLGLFALPAAIGVVVVTVVANRRGLNQTQMMRLVVPVGAVLLIAGLVLAMLTVPSARIVRGSDASGDASVNRGRVVAPTTTPFP